MQPKISVIVPVYNNEAYLERTVESLVRQTYPRLEIILVDDGSTDGSGRLCDALDARYDNVRALHQPNGGVSAARNRGIEAATGELIGFCDGDDTVTEDMYAFLWELHSATGADITACELQFLQPDGSVKSMATNEKTIWHSASDYIADLLAGKIGMSVDTKLFARSAIGDVRFPEGIRTYEDKYFCFLTALNAKTFARHSIAKYTYHRRVGSSSFTAFERKYLDGVTIAEKMLQIVEKQLPSLTVDARCHKLTSLMRVYKLMCLRGGRGQFPEKEAEILRYIRGFDKTVAKRYLRQKEYLRFSVLRKSKGLFYLMTKTVDKN